MLQFLKSFRKSSTPLDGPTLPTPSLENISIEENPTPQYNGVAPKDRWDQIKFAFSSGGINYFQFTTEVNIPFQRAVAARDILTEELWQINPQMLQAWAAGAIDLLTDKRKKDEKKLFEIGVFVSRLKEQLDLSYSLTRQLKLATVVYFDERENPLDYQYPYNADKLKHWTFYNDVPDFFLNLPQNQYLPSGIEFTMNLPTYLQTESQMQINFLTNIIGNLSLKPENEDMRNNLNGQMETLKELLSWSKGPSMNTL